jgi:alkylation response protein AidB-like acyl-CoA dehydrogenase
MERSELLEPFERMIADLFPTSRVREIERGAEWADERAAIEQSGFLDLLGPEDRGGAALSLDSAVPLFMALGRHAAPFEIGEAMLERASFDGSAQPFATAILLSAAIAGASERVLSMTVSYAGDRVQFGKPIGRQQSVQQQLAVMAEDCIAARLAVELAAADFPQHAAAKAAVAKGTAARVAARVANTAHAVHGAIGISREHDLQLFTRRLHAWRLRDGAETIWHQRLGDSLLRSGRTAVDWMREELFLEHG